MQISYAGIDLLLEDPDGAVARFIQDYMPLEDSRIICPDTMLSVTNQAQPRSGNRAFRGLVRPNYSTPPRIKINSLYWPTGAARWSTFYGLTDDEGYQKLYKALDELTEMPPGLGDEGSLANIYGSPSLLKLDDGKQEVSAYMYLLGPKPISARFLTKKLWLLPLVDIRYFGQFQPGQSNYDASNKTWHTILTEMAWRTTTFQYAPDVETINTDYLRPDPEEFSRGDFNATIISDAASLSVGMRYVALPHSIAEDIEEEDSPHKVQGWDTAEETLTENLELFNQGLVAGGGIHDQVVGTGLFPAIRFPERVNVIFPKWANFHAFTDGAEDVYFADATDVLWEGVPILGQEHTILSACYSVQAGGPEDNSDKLQALTDIIAEDFYKSLYFKYDAVMPGIKAWRPCAYDDFIEWSLGYRNGIGSYAAQTRVCSLPYNFGIIEQLSQDPDCRVYESPIRVKPRVDIAKGSSGACRIYLPSGSSFSKSSSDTDPSSLQAVADDFPTCHSPYSQAMGYHYMHAEWMGRWWDIVSGECPT